MKNWNKIILLKHYIDRVFLDGDPEFDNYHLRIGAFIRLTFEFKFKKWQLKNIEHRTIFMTKNVKIPISRKIRIGKELMNMRYTSGSIQGFIDIF